MRAVALLGLAAGTALLATGCAQSPTTARTLAPHDALGKTVDEVLDQVPSNQAAVEYDIAKELGIGPGGAAVDDPTAWTVASACRDPDDQLVLGAVKTQYVTAVVRARIARDAYKHVLDYQCSTA